MVLGSACSRTWSLGGAAPILGPWEGLVPHFVLAPLGGPAPILVRIWSCTWSLVGSVPAPGPLEMLPYLVLGKACFRTRRGRARTWSLEEPALELGAWEGLLPYLVLGRAWSRACSLEEPGSLLGPSAAAPVIRLWTGFRSCLVHGALPSCLELGMVGGSGTTKCNDPCTPTNASMARASAERPAHAHARRRGPHRLNETMRCQRPLGGPCHDLGSEISEPWQSCIDGMIPSLVPEVSVVCTRIWSRGKISGPAFGLSAPAFDLWQAAAGHVYGLCWSRIWPLRKQQ